MARTVLMTIAGICWGQDPTKCSLQNSQTSDLPVQDWALSEHYKSCSNILLFFFWKLKDRVWLLSTCYVCTPFTSYAKALFHSYNLYQPKYYTIYSCYSLCQGITHFSVWQRSRFALSKTSAELLVFQRISRALIMADHSSQTLRECRTVGLFVQALWHKLMTKSQFICWRRQKKDNPIQLGKLTLPFHQCSTPDCFTPPFQQVLLWYSPNLAFWHPSSKFCCKLVTPLHTPCLHASVYQDSPYKSHAVRNFCKRFEYQYSGSLSKVLQLWMQHFIEACMQTRAMFDAKEKKGSV